MNFEAGRLVTVNVPDPGASPRIMVASEEPVMIAQAAVTGGLLTLTVSNDNFGADNRIISDIRGNVDTGEDWPLFSMLKGERIDMTYTGTKASVRTRGQLLDEIDVPALGASPQILTANVGNLKLMNAVLTNGTLKITVSNDGFVLDNRVVCDIVAGVAPLTKLLSFDVLKTEQVKFEYTGGSVSAFVRTLNVLA